MTAILSGEETVAKTFAAHVLADAAHTASQLAPVAPNHQILGAAVNDADNVALALTVALTVRVDRVLTVSEAVSV